jgi:Spy/CpxP family protein refolding chaperone
MSWFRLTSACLVLTALAACSDGATTTAPFDPLALEQAAITEALNDFGTTETVALDRAGVGGSAFPDSIALTTEQKAEIERLHAQFREAHKADLEALAKLEADLRAARTSGKEPAAIRALIEQAMVIQRRLAEALKDLHEAIWRVYTPAQRTWLETRKPAVCRPDAALNLTDEQRRRIAALREAFTVSVKEDLALIERVAKEARSAHAAGKSREEIGRILAQATEAMKRIREAEARLEKAIDDLLTPEQRAKKCVRGRG